MCGRYLIDEEAFDLQEIIAAAEKNIQTKSAGTTLPAEHGFKSGEIFPGCIAPVIDANNETTFMLWGFPILMAGKRPHVNARSETAAESRTFSEAMAYRRCLVPASGYYEWKSLGKKHKEKYEFRLPDGTSMYMAGIYSADGKYAILTRDAAPAVAEIHDRMPVILPKSLGEVWLYESPDVIREALTDLCLQHIPKNNESSQMSLFHL